MRSLDDAFSTAEPGDWWETPAAPILVGEVSVTEGQMVRTRLVMPEVSPGSYVLMLCDLGCTEPLATSAPAEIESYPTHSSPRSLGRWSSWRDDNFRRCSIGRAERRGRRPDR